MEKNVKSILKSILKKNGFFEIQEIFVQNLTNILQEETFGNKIAKALNQRKQGHFDKAMLNISEANRDQVLSIKAIQAIIDKFKGSSKTEVVFEKFRQFYPFQIGLTNGKDVLELLSLTKLKCEFALDDLVTDLHKNEEIIGPMLKELDFFETRMKSRIPEDEINDLKKNVENITEKIFEIKTSLIDRSCGVVQRKYTQIPIEDKISLVKNIYLVISSSIQTLDAKFVVVEENTYRDREEPHSSPLPHHRTYGTVYADSADKGVKGSSLPLTLSTALCMNPQWLNIKIEWQKLLRERMRNAEEEK